MLDWGYGIARRRDHACEVVAAGVIPGRPLYTGGPASNLKVPVQMVRPEEYEGAPALRRPGSSALDEELDGGKCGFGWSPRL